MTHPDPLHHCGAGGQAGTGRRRVNKKAKKAPGQRTGESHTHSLTSILGAQWEAQFVLFATSAGIHTLTQGAVYKTLQFKIVMLHDESSRSL